MIVKTDVSFAALTFIYSPAQYNLISVKAFIHQPGMYDIEIKKGHTFRYDIWFGGEPPPTVTWEREGSVIQPEQASIKYCEHYREILLTHLTVQHTTHEIASESEVNDCHDYKLTSGLFTGSARVEVY